MAEELEKFRLNALLTEIKSASFATADAQLATPGSDSTATRIVSRDGEMTDFSADWQNTAEAPVTPGNLEMDLMTEECSADVGGTIGRAAKNMV